MSHSKPTSLRKFAVRLLGEGSARAANDSSDIYAKLPLVELASNLESMANLGFWRLDLGSQEVSWSPGVFHIHDLPVASKVELDNALAFYPPHHRPILADAIERITREGESYDLELDFISAKGNLKRVRTLARAERTGGQITALYGLFQDITERYRAAERVDASRLHDDVTGLPNARHFRQFYTDLGLGNPAAPACDHYSLVAVHVGALDMLGIEQGQKAQRAVLDHVARILRQTGDYRCFAARLGADDFALLMRDNPSEETLPATLAQLCAALRQPVEVDGEVIAPKIALGAMLRNGKPMAYDNALAEAETAMRLSNHDGQNCTLMTEGKPAISIACG